ncbi:MAG: tRNA pseudouridine(55) synthase TruB [Clostridia bacterium]|nr:tRNA pseudouridine(55) synthase TruB [Clostridia bacterium]
MKGLLLLDKPENKTSYGAVASVKKLSGEKRIGHTGTLDPMATGVLPILLGRATALSSYLLDADKTYIARIRLGTVTDTCDITGEILAENEVNVSETDLEKTVMGFLGTIKQRPPMFSALKKDGVRLYELARKGETVDIPEREVNIISLKILSALDNTHEFELEAHVSKGTYIRSLARDIGDALGCGATLTALRRTATSGFDISQCVPLDDLSPENLASHLLSEETVVKQFQAVQVTEKQATRFCNGGQLALERLRIQKIADGELLRVRFQDTFLGLGRVDAESGELAVRCVINNPDTKR